MADSVEYDDERLRVIHDRMIEAGIDVNEVSRLMKPLKDEFERRVCGLVWSHKTATQKMIQDMGQRLPLLTSSLDESIIQDENGRDHILVEGDNLYLLMAMQYTHVRNGHGMVDVIYIDPPYNTGSVTFDYNDRFEKSEWLSMMDVRLRLAHNVLTDDGVMFVQIDETYQAELKLLLNDVFGSNGHAATIHVEMSATQGMKVKAAQQGNIVKNAEYVFVYTKDGHRDVARNAPIYDLRPDYDSHYTLYMNDDGTLSRLVDIYDYKHPSDLLSGRTYTISEAYAKSAQFAEFVRQHKTRIVCSALAKIVASDDFDAFCRAHNLKNGHWTDIEKSGRHYLLTLNSKGNLRQLLKLSDSWGNTDSYGEPDGLRKIRGDLWKDFYKDMMNANKEGNVVFLNGKKPIRLIKQLVKMSTGLKPEAIVLDFFAGSGTTVQAVLELNTADGGHRQCILGTNNELGKDEVKQAKKLGYTEGSPQWESLGVCQRVTRKRMQNVFPSHEHDNLRFYRISESEMVDSSIDDGGDITRIQMAQRAVPYISLREEVYADEVHDDESYHMLMSSTKHVMVVTDVNMLTTDIEALAEAQGIDNLVVYCPICKSYDKSTIHYREYPRGIIDALRHSQARARQVTR